MVIKRNKFGVGIVFGDDDGGLPKLGFVQPTRGPEDELASLEID